MVAEITLSIILLGGGSILVQSFLSLRHSDPGFDMSGLLSVPLTLPDDEGVDAPAVKLAGKNHATIIFDIGKEGDATTAWIVGFVAGGSGEGQ